MVDPTKTPTPKPAAFEFQKQRVAAFKALRKYMASHADKFQAYKDARINWIKARRYTRSTMVDLD